MPFLNKKSSLSFTCSTSVVLVDNKTYYKYDIDLRLYTKILYTPNSLSHIHNKGISHKLLF